MSLSVMRLNYEGVHPHTASTLLKSHLMNSWLVFAGVQCRTCAEIANTEYTNGHSQHQCWYKMSCHLQNRDEQDTVTCLNIVDVDFPLVAELESTLSVLLGEGVCLVDFGILGQFAVRFYCKTLHEFSDT